MKTIKQLADELGVSKQAVVYRLKQLESTKANGILATKENGILMVSLAGEKLIKSAFSESDRQTFGDKELPNNHQTDSDILSVLKTTIDTLNTQLTTKDKQIAELTEIIKSQAQSINADRQKELAGKLIEGKTFLDSGADQESSEAPSPKKKTFFSRFLRKTEQNKV